MRLSVFFASLAVVTLLVNPAPAEASFLYNFDVFTSDGDYCDNPGMNMFVVVSAGISEVDFTFYNESLFKSSIARIYFDNGSLDDILSITNGPGTNFSEDFPGPENLPAGKTLDPPFQADVSVGAKAPPPKNGINSLMAEEEWVKVSFGLPAGETLQGIVGELNSGEMRIGVHVIALPDGSSESAILVTPEPGTIGLLCLGGLVLRRRRA